MQSLQWSRCPLIVWLSSELFDLAKKTLEHRKTVKKNRRTPRILKKLRKTLENSKNFGWCWCISNISHLSNRDTSGHVPRLPPQLRCPPLQIWGVKTPSFSYTEYTWNVEKHRYHLHVGTSIFDQSPISTNFGVQQPLSFHRCWWESPCF